MNQSALPRAGLCLLGAICLAAPHASALIELDRGVLILNTSFGVSYDSNILGQVDNESDTLLSLSPNLQYRRGTVWWITDAPEPAIVRPLPAASGTGWKPIRDDRGHAVEIVVRFGRGEPHGRV
jgi:hypothetical protein